MKSVHLLSFRKLDCFKRGRKKLKRYFLFKWSITVRWLLQIMLPILGPTQLFWTGPGIFFLLLLPTVSAQQASLRCQLLFSRTGPVQITCLSVKFCSLVPFIPYPTSHQHNPLILNYSPTPTLTVIPLPMCHKITETNYPWDLSEMPPVTRWAGNLTRETYNWAPKL